MFWEVYFSTVKCLTQYILIVNYKFEGSSSNKMFNAMFKNKNKYWVLQQPQHKTAQNLNSRFFSLSQWKRHNQNMPNNVFADLGLQLCLCSYYTVKYRRLGPWVYFINNGNSNSNHQQHVHVTVDSCAMVQWNMIEKQHCSSSVKKGR